MYHQVMALAQLGHLKEVLKTVEEGMRNSGPALSRAGILYSDTVSISESESESE